MFLVHGDTGYPKLFLALDDALSDAVARVAALPRWKNSRHGRKRWHIEYGKANGEPMTHVATIYSYAEEGQYEVRESMFGIDFSNKDFGGTFDLDSRERIGNER